MYDYNFDVNGGVGKNPEEFLILLKILFDVELIFLLKKSLIIRLDFFGSFHFMSIPTRKGFLFLRFFE